MWINNNLGINIFFSDYNKSSSIPQVLKYESLKRIGSDTKFIIKLELQLDLRFDIKNYFNTHWRKYSSILIYFRLGQM